jgi:tight adherence protein C
MDGLDALLTGDAAYVAVLVLVFGAIAGAVAAVNALVGARVDVMQDRLKRATRAGLGDSSMPPPTPASQSRSIIDFTFRPIAKMATPTDADDLGRLRAQLTHAGYRDESAMPIYLGVKVALALGLAGLFLWVNSLRSAPMQHASLFTVVVMILGFYAPNLWLLNAVEKRTRAISNSMPDALDLLVTCVEAGLGLDMALTRVAQEVGLSAPLLSQELLTTSLEMRAGMSRGDAFRRLAMRTGVEDIRNLSSIIIQTELFGTSVARALKVMSEGMRVRRMQRAEENAATVAVRMTFPLILCILPALLSTLLGPAIVRMIRILLPALGGGK